MTDPVLCFIAAAVIAAWGYRQKFLSLGGAVAAFVIGGCVWYGGRWGLAVPLVFFFVTSSLMTKWSMRKRQIWTSIANEIKSESRGFSFNHKYLAGRHTRRNIRQVAANGAVAAGCALIGGITGDPRWLCAGLCALAAMTGDTWSSEIGRALAERPFDLRTRRRIEAGISGAVSLPGTIAGMAGALCTALTGVFLLPKVGLSTGLSLAVIAGIGIIGVWFDSLLGATIQIRFTCESCGKSTDSPTHCGWPCLRTAGWPGINNDVVNLLTTIFAAGIFLWT